MTVLAQKTEVKKVFCFQLDATAARIQFVNPGRAMQPLLLPRCRIVGGAASAIVSGSIKGKKAPN